MMKSFPPYIKFCHPWRPYQQRVLEELDQHLEDQRLHVIAPPGSGKTVLGLEVIRRLDRPTLILAPTLAIRDQWIDRFVELFLPQLDQEPDQISSDLIPPDRISSDWISTDPDQPALLTAATYHAVHRMHKKRGKNPFSPLLRAKIGTLVVDEAHHLRNEWWKSLTALVKKLENPTVVALTATPPLDVSAAEWERYKSLCGPVDAQISVPELMIEENLCPHQDYLFLSSPADSEDGLIRTFRKSVDQFCSDLYLDFDFIDPIESHPWLVHPETHMEAIFERTEFFSAMLIFLKHVDRWISQEAAGLLGVEKREIPRLDPEWLEILLTHLLFMENQEDQSDAGADAAADSRLKEIRRHLSRMGAIERKKVVLRGTGKIRKTLTRSVGKLSSIIEIVKIESESLRDGLRMVILTDFIYAGDMPEAVGDDRPLRRIGVVPIFERIRREHLWKIRPGILSGSLVVIPGDAVADLEIIAVELEAELSQLAFSPLPHDPDFMVVSGAGETGKRMVRLMTELFRLGRINVLVGTKSLLGEGWDAPWINSLILASWVGAWVLSNQMRGRAIRTQAGNPEKTANIWHLVCIEPGEREPGGDLESLIRRFRAFVGVSFEGSRIESGMDRLGMPDPPLAPKEIEKINADMVQRAQNRSALAGAWKRALKNKELPDLRMREAVRTPAASIPGDLSVRMTTASLGLRLFVGIMGGLGILWAGGLFGGIIKNGAVIAGYALPLYLFLPPLFRNLRNWGRFGTDGESLRRLSEVIIYALFETGNLKNPLAAPKPEVRKTRDKTLYCTLEGGTTFETSLFLEALQELISPVENPRYLIRRRKKGFRARQWDYYAIPQFFAGNREKAETFFRSWKQWIGRGELIYTRTVEGRKALVRARIAALPRASAKAEQMRFWR